MNAKPICKPHFFYDVAPFNYPEVGKTQLEEQSETSATSAIAEVALRCNFYFATLRKLLCELKTLKFVKL